MIQSWKFDNRTILIIGIALAVLLRFGLIPSELGTYKNHLEPWYDFIVKHGGLGSLKYNFSNYNFPYLYWLVIASSFFPHLSKIFAIKLLAVGFDFVCAFFTYKLVQLKYPTGNLPLIAFLVVLFTPTVFLNSSYWGQCDSIYTTGIVACLYFLCIKRERLAFICYGIGFSFKLQALFLAPFLLILLLKKIVSWKTFLLIPTIYLMAVLPAWFVGKPFNELFFVYFNQANYYKELTKNAPNIYQWIPNSLYDAFLLIGFVLTLFMVSLVLFRVYKSKVKIDQERMIQLALISLLIIPYFLPKMHERYFFPADIVSIIFGFYFPNYVWVPIVVETASFFSYAPYLLGKPLVPLIILSMLLGGTIGFMLWHLTKMFPLERSKVVAS